MMQQRNITDIPADLSVPALADGPPLPGRRVRQALPAFEGTGVYHVLYLPTDHAAGGRYPVIVEYAGNGPYRGRYGDVCTGRVDDSCLGYGISGGEGFIWVCLPFVGAGHRHNELWWWGDVAATIRYCKDAVGAICRTFGGDPSAVFLAGFSRGAIACNYIGLHDDEIAALWRGFIAHSHYDGVREWDYPESDRSSAARRLARLAGRPQFISQEGSVDDVRAYLATACPNGPFTFHDLPFPNHTDAWILRDIPSRAALRDWVKGVLEATDLLGITE
jgi:hypothetical protein